MQIKPSPDGGLVESGDPADIAVLLKKNERLFAASRAGAASGGQASSRSSATTRTWPASCVIAHLRHRTPPQSTMPFCRCGNIPGRAGSAAGRAPGSKSPLTPALSPRGEGAGRSALESVQRSFSQPHPLADAATLRCKLAKASLPGEGQDEGVLMLHPARRSRASAWPPRR